MEKISDENERNSPSDEVGIINQNSAKEISVVESVTSGRDMRLGSPISDGCDSAHTEAKANMESESSQTKRKRKRRRHDRILKVTGDSQGDASLIKVSPIEDDLDHDFEVVRNEKTDKHGSEFAHTEAQAKVELECCQTKKKRKKKRRKGIQKIPADLPGNASPTKNGSAEEGFDHKLGVGRSTMTDQHILELNSGCDSALEEGKSNAELVCSLAEKKKKKKKRKSMQNTSVDFQGDASSMKSSHAEGLGHEKGVVRNTITDQHSLEVNNSCDTTHTESQANLVLECSQMKKKRKKKRRRSIQNFPLDFQGDTSSIKTINADEGLGHDLGVGRDVMIDQHLLELDSIKMQKNISISGGQSFLPGNKSSINEQDSDSKNGLVLVENTSMKTYKSKDKVKLCCGKSPNFLENSAEPMMVTGQMLLDPSTEAQGKSESEQVVGYAATIEVEENVLAEKIISGCSNSDLGPEESKGVVKTKRDPNVIINEDQISQSSQFVLEQTCDRFQGDTSLTKNSFPEEAAGDVQVVVRNAPTNRQLSELNSINIQHSLLVSENQSCSFGNTSLTNNHDGHGNAGLVSIRNKTTTTYKRKEKQRLQCRKSPDLLENSAEHVIVTEKTMSVPSVEEHSCEFLESESGCMQVGEDAARVEVQEDVLAEKITSNCSNGDLASEESKEEVEMKNDDVIIKQKCVSTVSHLVPNKPPVACANKKLLILDINGLLVDIVAGFPRGYKADLMVSQKSVFKRPFCGEFLQFCFKNFYVGVWSSRTRKNMDSIIHFLFGSFEHKLLFRWDRFHCTNTGFTTVENTNKPLVLKELKKLWENSDLPWNTGKFNKSNTLLLDDSPYKALRNPVHTAIFPYPYDHRNDGDTSLGPRGDICVYLEGLAEAENVQEYVSRNPFGQRAITEANASWGFYRKIISLDSSHHQDVSTSSQLPDLIDSRE